MSRTDLPEKFIERMKRQLPESEWEAFFAIYDEPPKKGVRVNTLKCPVETFEKIFPLPKKRVPWEADGFLVEAEKTGAHPYHAAGVYYSQEPSAMCAAPLLDVQKGERVLDLCAAPGGKSTKLAAAMQGEGILVLNEPVYSRAQILSSNVERMGITNALVLSAYPEELSAVFLGYFDKILVDAPCSGEGMFRKNAEEALREWSEENVALCAKRQSGILDEATKMLRVGGRLVYSTCTFSYEEDEGQVCDYLKRHPEMRLLKSEKLYPHKVEGEGHFCALFEKVDGEETCFVRPIKRKVSQASERLYRTFEKNFFNTTFAENLYEAGGMLYALPNDMPDWKHLKVVRAGVRLGEIKNVRFEPSHSLAMCAPIRRCKNVVHLSLDDPRVEKYLHGEEIEEDMMKISDGWCVVAVDGFILGLGRAVRERIKNHLPKGLRKN